MAPPSTIRPLRRGRHLSYRRSKLRMLSIPVLPSMDSEDADEMYYSEPECSQRQTPSVLGLDDYKIPARSSSLTSESSGSPLHAVAPGGRLVFAKMIATAGRVKLPDRHARSVEASDDEDGQLFTTITSEGADQVKEAAIRASLSPKRSTNTSKQEDKDSLEPEFTVEGSPFKDPALGVFAHVAQELRGVPETAQPSRLPPSLLPEYALVPAVVEYVINHGILVCVSALLYELTFMPISGLTGLLRWVGSLGTRRMTHIEKSDLLRTLILGVSVVVFNLSIDFSGVYHYIRAQSLLKLYFIYNMLEIIERLVRSWGNDLVDGMVRATAMGSKTSLLIHWTVVLVYSLMHAYLHFWRVMLISVAILANDMLIVLVTNNFNELKGTVFKKTEPRSVYPIISSDIVERVYLFTDVALVLFRMATSPQRSRMPFAEVSYWIGFMIALEIITDWLKFMCISKFNQIDNSTYWHYARIHKDDIRNSRNDELNPIPPLVQKGFVSASHLPGRRMNFMPTPLAILILCNVMLPSLVGSEPVALWTYRILLISGLFLAKVGLDWLLIADSLKADRSVPLPEKLQNIRAL